jgi:putative ABC transport system ATP-binding protein
VAKREPARASGSAQGSSGARVEVEGLEKRYAADGAAVVALDEVDLVVEAGSMVAVMGPSGSGKSTLLHLIGAMDAADAGAIRVGDVTVSGLSAGAQVGFRRRIGFVFQRFHLLPALTVVDNVAAPLLPYRVGFDKHARARELLAAVGLEGRERALPSELSGGQQQRVAIARALVNQPILLLADEPTGNLDSQTGAEIVELIRQLRDQLGTTIILATHDNLVASRCDQVIRLLDGHVLDQVDVTPAEPAERLLERISRIDA